MSGPNPSTRKPLWIIMAAFSVVLVANGFLVYYAANTWTGLETEQHFAKGLAYNTNLQGAKRQKALGWQARLSTSFEGSEGLSGTSRIQFTDRNNQPLRKLDVRIIAIRPTHEGYDKEFALSETGDGIYQGAFTLPLKGQWDFRILAQRGDNNYQRVERIVTP
jgi:nitrogen fixation protein FixH